jgi:mono/diheme cytochrome c family protein
MLRGDSTRYDRRVSRRVRLIVIPACLFLGVSAAVFALAWLALAEPSAPTTSGDVVVGDQYRGQVVYSETCAACHGESGEGGIGPRLEGNPISLAAAKAQIDAGGGTMPPQLVSGRQEEDVLAYLATLFASEE